MQYYYINKNQQPNGDFEVHVSFCIHGAEPANQTNLGLFANCRDAIVEAKRRFPHSASNINGCYYCANPCHTS